MMSQEEADVWVKQAYEQGRLDALREAADDVRAFAATEVFDQDWRGRSALGQAEKRLRLRARAEQVNP